MRSQIKVAQNQIQSKITKKKKMRRKMIIKFNKIFVHHRNCQRLMIKKLLKRRKRKLNWTKIKKRRLNRMIRNPIRKIKRELRQKRCKEQWECLFQILKISLKKMVKKKIWLKRKIQKKIRNRLLKPKKMRKSKKKKSKKINHMANKLWIHTQQNQAHQDQMEIKNQLQ